MLTKSNHTSFRKGHEPWNKGLSGYGGWSHTAETRAQIASTRRANQHTYKKRSKQGDVEKECLWCGRIFKVIYGRRKSAKFCSRACNSSMQSSLRTEHFINVDKEKLRIANSLRMSGAKGCMAPSWRGGKTSVAAKIRNSKEYALWRQAVFERDNFTCVFCGDSRGGNLQADHIKPFAHYPELRFELSNGRTLCKSCHKMTDTYLEKARYKKYAT